MVTAETAVVLPVLLVVLVAAVWVLACVSAQLRCVDAARSSARLLARGEALPAVLAAARDAAPSGAAVDVRHDGDTVVVVVSARVRPPGTLAGLPPVDVRARAAALDEDTAVGPP
jgi:Flp pilus assembly protein TadG